MGINKAILFQKHQQAEMDATKPGCSSLPLLLVEVQALVVEPGFIPLITQLYVGQQTAERKNTFA